MSDPLTRSFPPTKGFTRLFSAFKTKTAPGDADYQWSVLLFQSLLRLLSCIFLSLSFFSFSWVQAQTDTAAQRIISLSPAITELLFSAGAGKQVVGVVSYSDFPPQARKIQQIGSYQALDMEQILKLKPDLIIAWKSGTPEHYLTLFEQLGLKVHLIDPSGFDDIAHDLIMLGRLTGHEALATKKAQHFLQAIERIKKTSQNKTSQNKKKIRVLIQIWDKPIMTIGKQHIIHQVIEICGGSNVFPVDKKTITIDLESVVVQQPDIIISTAHRDINNDWLQTWQAFEQIPAVRHKHLYHTAADVLVRHSLRLLQGIQNVCQLLDKARFQPDT